MTVPSVGKILNDAQVSLAVHKKCVKQMIQRRHADQDTFLPELCNAILFRAWSRAALAIVSRASQ